MDYTREFEVFDVARRYWPGVKRGGRTEFNNFRRKHKDWKKALPLLKPAIEEQEYRRVAMAKKGDFVPARKHFQTWINNRCWEETEGQEFTEEEFKAQYDKYLEDKKRALEQINKAQLARETAREQAREKLHQKQREENKAMYDWPENKLKAMRKEHHWLGIWWLLDEILNERNKQKDKLGAR